MLSCRFLPKNLKIIGYARSKLSDDDLKEKIKGYLKGEEAQVKEFLDRIHYIPGSYDGDEGFQVCHRSTHSYRVQHHYRSASSCDWRGTIMPFQGYIAVTKAISLWCYSELAKGAGGEGSFP